MYIYIDILLITNLYTNFFLLKTTAKLVHMPLRNSKCIIAALAGSLFSLIILLPQLNSAVLLIIRIASAAVMILVSFSGKTIREIYRTSLIFFFVSFIFAGFEYGISILFNNGNMLWHNSTLYVDISMITLVISTIISYVTICIFRYYLDSKNIGDYEFTIVITYKGKSTTISAVGDTCNNLTDVFTGKPVIVCGKEAISGLLDNEESKLICDKDMLSFVDGWRLIPFSTIHSDGILPIFKPTAAIIKCSEKKIIKPVDVYIGIVNKNMDNAVFNPKILN
ncbi:MAG: sigma-E processing peptidase SpoIIGA [Oscillospiraceae bacterium]|nr:sigma-E processing peptidase SpoIIGA [Oscillospiraceae bacterium]